VRGIDILSAGRARRANLKLARRCVVRGIN
jgi:hypothetical protein